MCYHHSYLSAPLTIHTFIQNLPKVIFIDNSAFDDYDAKYLGRSKHLKNAFVTYLESISHKEAKNVKMSKIVRFKMPWRTSHNHVDCGVFLMRHMETYQGNDEKEWDAGFALEEDKLQKRQLVDLRRKYAAKILLHDVNEAKNVVLSEMKNYLDLPADEKRYFKRRHMLELVKD
ncbi:hypothetical protein R6Q57_003981 [Mikania cordata]